MNVDAPASAPPLVGLVASQNGRHAALPPQAHRPAPLRLLAARNARELSDSRRRDDADMSVDLARVATLSRAEAVDRSS